MIDSAQPSSGTIAPAATIDPTREAEAARAVLPHVQAGMAVLDLSCGAGWSTLLLAARTTATEQQPVTAWDPCPEARAAAQANVTRANFESRVQFAAPEAANTRFDLIFASHRSAATVAAAVATTSLRPGGTLALIIPPEAAADAIAELHCAGFVPLLASSQEPLLLPSDLPQQAGDVVLIAQRAKDRLGFAVRTYPHQAQLLQAVDCGNPGVLLEDDLDIVENDCERHGRKRRDAEVLCGLAASYPGPCLDLGTSHGRSAFKLATNIGRSIVTTVNMLPEQAVAAGVHITHVLRSDEIGSYPRERGVHNIRQLYANTLDWNWHRVPYGLHLAFVDACHDEEAVLADSLQAWHRLGTGGFLVWHDFSPALQKVHPWIESSMAGVRRFVAQVQPAGEIHHLLGSWCGVLRKEASDA